MMEVSETATRNIEIILRPMRSPEQDAQYCHDQAESIARKVNNQTSDSSGSFQFLLAASTAPVITTTIIPEPSPMPSPTPGVNEPGGAGSTAALSFLALALIAFMTVVFF